MAISRKRCKIGGKLILRTNRKSYMSFRLVPKSVTLNEPWTASWPSYCVISANSGSFGAHCIKVHVCYLISWWVLVCVTVIMWHDFPAEKNAGIRRTKCCCGCWRIVCEIINKKKLVLGQKSYSRLTLLYKTVCFAGHFHADFDRV